MNYDDIRPYHDHEVAEVVQRLINDNELIDALSEYQAPAVPALLRRAMYPKVRSFLHKTLDDVVDVVGFQQRIAPLVEQLIGKTTSGFTSSGLESLPDRPCLFLSNHRDIVMDPTLVNYALYHARKQTTRIAIGDNLLKRPYVSDLMRLNKSFIVQRSVAGRREKVQAFHKLSSYIADSLAQGKSVWIAHREGRSKNGDDRTDTAILKMLHMAYRASKTSFADMLEQVAIVPVSVSYEYDPCDMAKAHELYALEETGVYSKQEDEDLRSIVTGLEGWKGRVHVAFGKPLSAELGTPLAAARNADQQMHSLYQEYPSNWLAYEQLAGERKESWRTSYPETQIAEHESEFQERLAKCPEAVRPLFLENYANPIRNKLATMK